MPSVDLTMFSYSSAEWWSELIKQIAQISNYILILSKQIYYVLGH